MAEDPGRLTGLTSELDSQYLQDFALPKSFFMVVGVESLLVEAEGKSTLTPYLSSSYCVAGRVPRRYLFPLSSHSLHPLSHLLPPFMLCLGTLQFRVKGGRGSLIIGDQDQGNLS